MLLSCDYLYPCLPPNLPYFSRTTYLISLYSTAKGAIIIINNKAPTKEEKVADDEILPLPPEFDGFLFSSDGGDGGSHTVSLTKSQQSSPSRKSNSNNSSIHASCVLGKYEAWISISPHVAKPKNSVSTGFSGWDNVPPVSSGQILQDVLGGSVTSGQQNDIASKLNISAAFGHSSAVNVEYSYMNLSHDLLNIGSNNVKSGGGKFVVGHTNAHVSSCTILSHSHHTFARPRSVKSQFPDGVPRCKYRTPSAICVHVNSKESFGPNGIILSPLKLADEPSESPPHNEQ